MMADDPSNARPTPEEEAFEAFRAAWLDGDHLDPEAFCASQPQHGEALRQRIERFLFVARGIRASAKRQSRPLVGETPGDSLAAGKVIGDFSIVRKIGSGGMGVVYEAEQLSLRRRVALKVLRSRLSFMDDAVMKFRREAEAGGRQQHPGIVMVHAVGEEEGVHYIAQELIEGGYTLAERLREQGTQTAPPPGRFIEAARFIREIALALQHAHDSGVIHRDIKPSNILITRDGRPKVTDFGLAKVENALALSRTGDLSGTPYYMSPEQSRIVPGGVDARTDIFSLGVTFYEMLTLKRPFEGETATEVLEKIARADPRDPLKENPAIPGPLAWICMKALEKNPGARYDSMRAFAEDLERFLEGEETLARPAGLVHRAWKRVRRNPIASLAALLMLILAIYLPWSYQQMSGQADRSEAQRRALVRFTDAQDLSRLKAEADTLWPAYPEKIEAMEQWLVRADALCRTIPLHEQELDGVEDQGHRENLQNLIQELRSFADEKTGIVKSVKNRLAFAQEVIAPSMDKQRQDWQAAAKAIADTEECPWYQGLVLSPQPGLVPLGPDPLSGLWEFGHLPTGDVPERGPDGQLLLKEASGIVLVLLPGGPFLMGTDPTAGPGEPNEGPVHAVTVAPFFLSKYEMTQGQWLRWVGENPSVYSPSQVYLGKTVNLLHPVENISWIEARQVLFQLGLRLPSEAEWEYAARAGTSTTWWSGRDETSLVGKANLIDKSYGRHMNQVDNFESWLDDGYVVHAPVRSFLPNPFGLHDVYGNVSEWCEDTWHADYRGAPTDGKAWVDPMIDIRVNRGGCWDNLARVSRSAKRSWDAQEAMDCGKGVRPALSLRRDQEAQERFR